MAEMELKVELEAFEEKATACATFAFTGDPFKNPKKVKRFLNDRDAYQKKVSDVKLELYTHCPIAVHYLTDNFIHEQRKLYRSSTVGDATYTFNNGNIMFARGRPREAIEMYRKSVRFDPKFIEAWDQGTRTFGQLQLLDSAEVWARKSLEIQPEGSVAAELLTSTLILSGKHIEAVKEIDKMLEQNPANGTAYLFLARDLAASGKGFDIALESLEYALSIFEIRGDTKYVEAVVLKADILLMKNKKSAARKLYKLSERNGYQISEETKQRLK